MDLSGRINPPLINNFEYHFKIKDQLTGYKTVFLLKVKSKAFDPSQSFYTLVRNKHPNHPMCLIYTDRGGGFNSMGFHDFL